MAHRVGHQESLLTDPSYLPETDNIPMDGSGEMALRPNRNSNLQGPRVVGVIHLPGPQRAMTVYRRGESNCSLRNALVITSIPVASIDVAALAYAAKNQLLLS